MNSIMARLVNDVKVLRKKNVRVLVFMGIIRAIIDTFEDSFIGAQLAIISGQMTSIVVYNVCKYAVCIIMGLFFGGVVKRHRKVALRLGIMSDIAFLYAFSILENNLTSISITGAIHGISILAYYLPLESIYADSIGDSNDLHQFSTLSDILTAIVSIVLPILIGTIAVRYSFKVTLLGMTVLGGLQMAISIMLHEKVKTQVRYSLSNFIREVKADKGMKSVFWLCFFLNFFRGVCVAGSQRKILDILIIFMGKTLEEFGAFLSLISILNIVVNMIFLHFSKADKYAKTAKFVAVMHIINITIFLIYPNTLILAYMSVILMQNILSIICRNYKYISVELSENFAIEFQVIQEVALNLGRIIAWIVTALFTSTIKGTSVALLTMNIALIGLLFVVHKISRKFSC